MLYLTKLKTILQSKKTYLFLIIFLGIYLFVRTILIKYDTKIQGDTIEGVVTQVSTKQDKISFILKGSEKILCTYYQDIDILGKKVVVEGILDYPNNNSIPNTFNYQKYLYNNQIYQIMNVKKITILDNENILYKIKKIINNRINQYELQTKTYLNIFILGNKDYLEDDLYQLYQNNGIWHLFAISGMHISLIVYVLNKILSKLKYKNIIISIVLGYFMFLTNFSASVLRVSIFFILKNILHYLKIPIDNKKILFLTGFSILIIKPFMIYNVGFQYSFLISYALLLNKDKITGKYLMKLLKISLIAFIVSLPITVNLNYEINLISIFLNIICVPFITFLIFPLSIMTFILPFLENIFLILINIFEYLNSIFNKIPTSIIIPKIPMIFIVTYYIIIYLLMKKPNKKWLVMYFSLILMIIVYPKFDKYCYVYYLDVGQGDSIVIISPNKDKSVMIDTGGNNYGYNISSKSIQFLKSLGINQLDALILTHGDSDHMKDSNYLVKHFKVNKVIFNNDTYNELELKLINILKDKNINYYQNIDQLQVNNINLQFLNTRLYDNENDNSNVIYFNYYKYQFLFMGDAGIVKENDILKKYSLNNIDFLKVGHHGSNSSSSKRFIDSIKTKYAIISVGANNLYGHPTDNVLNNLSNSKIYRTDIDGTIEVRLSKNKYQIRTYSR